VSELKMKDVTIVCDGSSLGNGKGDPRAAAVALLGFQGLWKGVGNFLGRATNQQAEIAAAAIGLEELKVPCRVRLFSDSLYVVNTMTGRFRRKTNHDWWSRLDRAAERHTIEWNWIKGHSGHAVQEAADKTARKIASLGRVDPELLSDAVVDLGTVEL